MCYVRLDSCQAQQQGSLLSTSQWLQLAREAKSMGVLSLEVTGGEAMTRPDFSELYTQFLEMGFLINLRSNGYLLAGERFELITRHRPTYLGITLYGASDEMYKKVCGISDGFSIVTDNIVRLQKAGIAPRLSMTTTTENSGDWEAAHAWAAAHGMPLKKTNALFTPIRNAKRDISHLRAPIPEVAFDSSETEGLQQRVVLDKERYRNPFWLCRAFGAMFCVTWDGRMTLCNTLPAIWKDPFKLGLSRAYRELYNDLRSVSRPKECLECHMADLCPSCPAQLYSATGNLASTNDETCRMARLLYKTYYCDDERDSR